MTTTRLLDAGAVRGDPAAAPASGSKRRAPGNARRSIPLTLLMLPAAVLVTVAFLLPVVDVFVRSLTDPRLGFENYVWLVRTPVNAQVFLRTLVTALVVTLICLVLAYPYAYLMTVVRRRTRTLMTTMVMLPLWTSLLVRTLAWVMLLQDTGPINDFFEAVGIGRQALIRTPLGVGIGMIQILLPFMVMPLYSSMSRMPGSVMQAASSLGADRITAFRTIHLPLARPGIVAGSTTVFIIAMGFYIVPSLLGSAQETLVSALMYQQIAGFLKWGQGTALGVAMLVLTLVCVFLGTRLGRNRRNAEGEGDT